MRQRFARAGWLVVSVILVLSRASAAQETTVADAAERRDRTMVVALLEQSADVNGAQPDGARALHWAAHWNDLSMGAKLLRAGADPNAANDYGVTPLFLAATNGSVEMITSLLQAGADPNTALPSGETALMTAARTGSVPAVEALHSAGAAVDAAHATKGQTALMWAVAERHHDVVRALLTRGASARAQTTSGFTPVLFAARTGDIELVRLLLANGAGVNESSHDGATPLLTATVRGHIDLALFLLAQMAGADGNAAIAGYTPLHWASTTLETTLITYPGLPVPGEWEAIAGIPDRNAKTALIEALLAHGADVNARTTKPLLVQAPPGGGSFSSAPGIGATPFFAAAASGDADVMRLLLAHGADPSIRSNEDETPLMIATAADIDISFRVTEAKRLEAMRLAWEAGNDLEAADSKGHRALHLAARGGFHEIIKFLVDHGADLNPLTKSRTETRDREGGRPQQFVEPQTPLGLVEGTIYINFYERPATAEFLRKLGARSMGRYFPEQSQSGASPASDAGAGSGQPQR